VFLCEEWNAVLAGDEGSDETATIGGDVDAVLTDVEIDRDKLLNPSSLPQRSEVAQKSLRLRMDSYRSSVEEN